MRDNYIIYEELGKGSYGEVRRCVYKKDKRKTSVMDNRAVKILMKNYMENRHHL